jgi:uncharacterized membrane protein
MPIASNTRGATRWLCISALFMALNVVMSSFGIPVPGGHLYLNDVIIDVAAILLDPLAAFLVGGVGAFLGDFFFYPTPMFVSLVTRGLQAVAISVISRRLLQKKPVAASSIGVAAGALISVIGYSIGRAFIYATPEAALLKLPYQLLMAFGGGAIALVLCWKSGVEKQFHRWMES